MGRDDLRVTPSCTVAADELEWRFTSSGGPGGQHANTSNTRVEVRFDVSASTSLGPRQRARLLARLGPVVTAVAADERSQARNRAQARERLRSRLAAGPIPSACGAVPRWSESRRRCGALRSARSRALRSGTRPGPALRARSRALRFGHAAGPCVRARSRALRSGTQPGRPRAR